MFFNELAFLIPQALYSILSKNITSFIHSLLESFLKFHGNAANHLVIIIFCTLPLATHSNLAYKLPPESHSHTPWLDDTWACGVTHD